jgi:hypothetical protein
MIERKKLFAFNAESCQVTFFDVHGCLFVCSLIYIIMISFSLGVRAQLLHTPDFLALDFLSSIPISDHVGLSHIK